MTETLNSFDLIHKTGILLAWLILDIALVAYLLLGPGWSKIFTPLQSFTHQVKSIRFNPFLSFSLLSFSIIFALTGLVALVAPPNTDDVLTYHMSRVMHWLQNQSIYYYPTNVVRQLDSQPWTGFVVLHLQALSDGDRFANLVQWTSMVGCLIGVSLIAKELGANQIGQILSSAICLSIPIGLLESVTTQNDYVVSFWLTCLAYKFLLIIKGHVTSKNNLEFGLSLGLALLTKGVTYIYALPFLIIWFWFIWKYSRKQLLQLTTLGLLPALLLNSTYWWRNIQVFHNFLGISNAATKNHLFTPQAIISNFLRNVALHLPIPLPWFNSTCKNLILFIHNSILGLDVNDPRTTFNDISFDIPIRQLDGYPISLDEDISGNLLHLILSLIAIGLYLRYSKARNNERTLYLAALLSTVFLFCTLLCWQPWGTRLHLPFFVLISAFIGSVFISVWDRLIIHYLLVFLLTLSALPYCLFSTRRPLLTNHYFSSSLPKILETPRLDQYFAYRNEDQAFYIEAMNVVREAGCYDIGLRSSEGLKEYLLWVVARSQSPGSNPGFRFRAVDIENMSNHIKSSPEQTFLPCAIFQIRRPGAGKIIRFQDALHGEHVYKRSLNRKGIIRVYLRKDVIQEKST